MYRVFDPHAALAGFAVDKDDGAGGGAEVAALGSNAAIPKRMMLEVSTKPVTADSTGASLIETGKVALHQAAVEMLIVASAWVEFCGMQPSPKSGLETREFHGTL